MFKISLLIALLASLNLSFAKERTTIETFPLEAMDDYNLAEIYAKGDIANELIENHLRDMRNLMEQQERLTFQELFDMLQTSQLFTFLDAEVEINGEYYPDFDNLFFEVDGHMVSTRFPNFVESVKIYNLRPAGAPEDESFGDLYFTDINFHNTTITIRPHN